MSQELQEGKPESQITINVPRKVGKQNGKGGLCVRVEYVLEGERKK